MRIRFALGGVLLVAIANGAGAQQGSNSAFVTWARANAKPLSVTATGTDADMRAFDAIIGSAKVVMYGEPTHGTHEPLAMRNRLIKYLVEQKGFTAVALETGFTESAAAHAIVLGGPGDIASTVRGTFSWGFGDLPENVELITWLRQWNANPAHRRKVNFYGIDLGGGANDGFPNANRVVTTTLRWLDKNNPSSAAVLHKRLDLLLPKFTDVDYLTLTTFERQAISSSLVMLDTVIGRMRTPQSGDDYFWAARNAKVALQLNQMLAAAPPMAVTRGIPPEAYRQMNIRDSSMAANLKWVVEREGPGAKVIAFAHNAHVMNSKVTGGMWSSLRIAPSAMGTHVRRMFGPDAVIIGSTAGGTTGALPPMEDDPTGFDAALAAVGKPRFVLDLRPARAVPAVNSWLAVTRGIHANLTSRTLIAPATAYDAVVFFQTLSPSQ